MQPREIIAVANEYGYALPEEEDVWAALTLRVREPVSLASPRPQIRACISSC
jgi:hypothetical protein